jgi:hypothetical protein
MKLVEVGDVSAGLSKDGPAMKLKKGDFALGVIKEKEGTSFGFEFEKKF